MSKRGTISTQASCPPRKLAPQACLSCKKRRRKCSKLLPGCTECLGLSRPCEYRLFRYPSRKSDIAGTTNDQPLERIPLQVPQGSKPSIFQVSKNKQVSIPAHVLSLLGTPYEILVIQEDFFMNINPWMPIVSTRLLREALSDQSVLSPELILLLLSMKLIISKLHFPDLSSARSNLYTAAKELCAAIEVQEQYSTRLIQSSFLISLYEMGHAIYPEAQLSIAKTAKLGIALGIHDINSERTYPKYYTWVEEEERSRIWWGVVILDRFITLRIRGRKLITPNPEATNYIPVDDAAWEEDTPIPRETLGSPLQTAPRFGVFGREAHASYLLGQVINLKLLEGQGVATNQEIIRQLSSTLDAFHNVLMNDIEVNNGAHYSTAVSMCNSAMIALHTPSLPPNSTTVPPHKRTLDQLSACKESAERVLSLTQVMFAHIEMYGEPTMSPLVPDSFFQAAFLYACLWNDTGNREFYDALCVLKKGLEVLGKRWGVAGEYLRLLELQLQTMGPPPEERLIS